MDRIKIGIGVSSIGRFLPLVGKAAGLFDRAGLAVEVVNQNDEEKVVEDIVSRETPIGTPNAPSMLFSLLDGNDLVIVGGVLNRPAFYFAAKADIGGVADLMGKRIAMNQPRRMAGMCMLALLEKWGLDSKIDLTLLDLGLNDKSLEALRAGEIDAALLPPEKAFLAEEEGFRIIADTDGLDCHWVPLATTRRFLATNRDLVAKVASIYAASIAVFRDRPRDTLTEIANWLPALVKNSRVIERCYGIFAERFEPTLRPSPASLDSILREVARQDGRAAAIEPASIVERVL